MTEPGSSGSPLTVPLFPLPNVVLFPRAVLPLHIFEQRYRAMTADALAGSRQVAMALLRPGWEKAYYGRPAIEPVVCVGTILSHEELPDGKYNFLLQGTLRGRVVAETGGRPGDATAYRLATIEPLKEREVPEIDLARQREMLVRWFTHDAFAHTSLGHQFRQLLSQPLPTAAICDLLAFSYLDDVQVKQSLLAECCVATRVQRTLTALNLLRPRLWPSTGHRGGEPSLN